MYCVNCGGIIDDDSVFCTLCGKKVAIESKKATSNSLKKLIFEDFDRYDSYGIGREIKIVKELVRLFGMRLDEAAAIVKCPPSLIKDNLNEDEALKCKTALEAVGALIRID